jgi:predicted cupin superfamily sugar epimerase
MNTQNSAYWISHLQMSRHPEGGYYKETYRSDKQVLHTGATELRSACTSIYYLLEKADYSGFHKLSSDEIWYFHTGSPLSLHIISPEGHHFSKTLSGNADGDWSIAIPAHHWFAAEIPSKSGYCLVSCAVAPGFEFSELEMANKELLAAKFPEHSELLMRLSR